MTREEIKNKVVAIVADRIGFPVSEIKESTRFNEDLGTDSLDDIELLMEFEHAFGIKIPDEEMFNIVTVGDVINGLAKKLVVEEGIRGIVEQKHLEWSEEDERMLKAIIGGLGCIQKAGCERFGGEEMSDVILWIKNRFKSLRPQPQWKPSEEQMEALKEAVYQLDGSEYSAGIDSLYNDLQKL
jgi:acyl carrier protein